MSSNSLFLDYLYDTTLLSKSYKNDIIANIYKNNSKSSTIIELLNKSKFKLELANINKKKDIELYNNFIDKYDDLHNIMRDLANECGDYEYDDIDKVTSELVDMCEESHINYTNEDGETILFYLLRQYYDNDEYENVDFEGCNFSLMDIFDALILNKNFDIDIKNKDGIDAYNLCKDLGNYSDSEEEDQDEFDEDDYDPCVVICKMSYRRKLNKKKLLLKSNI
jgi:hypothetical protein